ncbi:MAG: GT-D fold domain-containing glycosyltransferase [Acidobacteriota bacterium]|nr:GT-D fold domain-containing glycosyltransferase [Acidobacteriota bacterium]
MASYPDVLDERATLALVAGGKSIARYGDGEFKLCADGSGIKSQVGDAVLAQRLRAILRDSGDCLVGIPNIRSNTPKADFWGKHMGFGRFLVERPYVSSFISRPDSAPWINTDDYWQHLESLWVGQAVTLVRGSSKSLVAEDLVGAGHVTEVVCARQHAWADYAQILERVGTPARALICLGPTATVLAADLCARGVHAIDLGHIGMFLRKRRRGEPMWVTDKDKG